MVLFVVPICLFLIPALSDSQSNSLLNGNFVVAMFKREITFKGIVIEYSGSDTKVERINCTDRIEEELILQVIRRKLSSWCLELSFCKVVFASHFPDILRMSSVCNFSLWKSHVKSFELDSHHCFHRSCVWETSTTQMSVTPSTYPSRNTGNSLCGIPQAPGLSATTSVRVRA